MTKILSINIYDVDKAGSVSDAIVEAAGNNDTVACGVQGCPESTFDSTDTYATRALEGESGMVYYVNENTGLVAEIKDGDLVWSEYSGIELVVPSEDDALQFPEALGQMFRGVKDYHDHFSKVLKWEKLVDRIRVAAYQLDD
jgi:hypothetical protein